MRALYVGWLYFRVGAMNELQYRANFFVAAFQSLLALGTGLVVLALVFSHTQELRGWTHAELLAVLGIQILMGGLIHTIVQPNMLRLMEEVRDGKLDYALMKPEDAQVMVSVRDIRIWQSVDIISGAIVLAVALVQLGREIGPLDVLAFAAALVLGAAMIYCFWLVLSTGAFWVINMWTVAELFEGLYQSGRWPVGVYPGWLRYSLTYLVPIAFAVTVPAQAVTSQLHWSTLVAAAAFAVALFAFTRWFWRFGLRRYSGASA
jgi:ABC-2 type transport system permease protein